MSARRAAAGAPASPASLTAARRRALTGRLASLAQGDVITLGATSIVGRGPSPTVSGADQAVEVGADQVWTLTLVSDLGYYVVLSQDCDIVRDPDVEPCLLVCPLEARPIDEWEALRRGPYSPREFPFPSADSLALPAGTAPVANLRFVTSLDKTALLSSAFAHVPALRSAPRRERFASWLGRRAARAPHPDALETDVLSAAGKRVRDLAKQYAKKKRSGGLSLTQMLVGAAEEWFLAPGERLVPLQLIVTPSSAAGAGLWDDSTGQFDERLITRAAADLARDLSRRSTPDLGYVVTVEVHTLDRVSAATYRTWAEWTWDHDPGWTGDGGAQADAAR